MSKFLKSAKSLPEDSFWGVVMGEGLEGWGNCRLAVSIEQHHFLSIIHSSSAAAHHFIIQGLDLRHCK